MQSFHLFVVLISAVRNGLALLFSPSQDPPKADDLLWAGFDVFDADDKAANRNIFGPQEMGELAAFPNTMAAMAQGGMFRVGVEVLGLQNSGTNLLSTLLYKNFWGQVEHYDSTFGPKHTGPWKHANMHIVNTSFPDQFDNLLEHKVVPLVMVRNPLSWLQSMKKAPYELAECVTGDDWLTRACTHKVPAGYVPDKFPQPFHYLSGVWGRWTESYEPVLNDVFQKAIVLRYEDLVVNTTATMKMLAGELNLTMPHQLDLASDPAKKHGHALGHAAALLKIQTKQYLDEYNATELREVCKQLKFFRGLLEQYNYSECTVNVTSNVTANVTSKVTASVASNVTANVTSNVRANVTSNVRANVTSTVRANVTSTVRANVTSNVTANVTSTVRANVTRNVTGNVTSK